MDRKQDKPKSSYTKGQRIVAMIGVILLIGLYIVTLIAGLTTSPKAPELFRMCIGSSILLPIMFWLYIRFAKMFSDRDRMRYQELMQSEEEEPVEENEEEES